MKNDGTLIGLWIVRVEEGDVGPMLARVHNELYALAFTTAPKALACMAGLGAQGGKPFYVLGVNVDRVVRELAEQGARGFIVDYSPEQAIFASAHPLPLAASAAELA
jgi:hypothetical protein